MSELIERVKVHFGFTGREVSELLVTILVVTFIFGFNDGSSEINASRWLFNFFNMFLIVTLAFLVHVGVQKFIAVWTGHKAEYRMWSFGLAIGVILAISSKGNLFFFLPGGILVSILPTHRLGRFRYGLNYGTMGWIAASGPGANVLLGMFTKQVMNMFGFANPLMDQLIFINFLIAFFTMLPVPPMDGMLLYFGTRLGYAFCFGIVFGYVVLFLLNIFSLILALLIGVAAHLAYHFLFEKENW
ncbi:MAG: hypothetical protein ABH879_04095 [archaeon]